MAAVADLREQTIPVRPPLKWAGGKRWLVPHLAELWTAHQHSRLVEPFCGGLAVALSLRPKRALLNDINPHAVHFYSWLKRGLEVDDRLEFANREALFYEHRSRFNQLISNGGAASAEAAALFYYLNRTCYNGLCRFNSSGQFNVPFGRYKRINYRRDFSSYRCILGNWQFSTGTLNRSRSSPTTSSMLILRTTWNSGRIRRRVSVGTTRFGWRSGCQSIGGRPSCRIRPPIGSSDCTQSLGSSSA